MLIQHLLPSHDKNDFKNIDLLREGTLEDSNDTNLYALAFGVSNQPDDYFSPQGARWYGYNDKEGYQSSSAIKSAILSIANAAAITPPNLVNAEDRRPDI